VVQEHSAPIKGRFVEVLGYYRPTMDPKEIKVDHERVKHWISVGAKPSDSVAALLKKDGMEGMDKYMDPRNKKRKPKKEQPEEAPAAAPAAEAPAEEPAAEEPAAEEPAAEEPAAEEPAAEEPAAEEPAVEEKSE